MINIGEGLRIAITVMEYFTAASCGPSSLPGTVFPKGKNWREIREKKKTILRISFPTALILASYARPKPLPIDLAEGLRTLQTPC